MGLFQVELTGEKSGPFRIVRLALYRAGLSQEFSGYRIVQLTDLHLGLCTPLKHIALAWEAARSLEPDLVVLTGDLIQYGGVGVRHILATKVNPALFRWLQYRRKVRLLVQDLARLLESWQPPDGILGVFGNHDYHEGIGTIRRKLEHKVQWLKNEAFVVQRSGKQLVFYGLDDFRHGRPNIKKTLRAADSQLAEEEPAGRILLAHNPDLITLPNAELLQEMDLILCGHTHGGQICLPSGRPILTRTHQREHVAGLSMVGNTPLYVSRGVGFGGLPFRLNCPPEIVLTTLLGSD